MRKAKGALLIAILALFVVLVFPISSNATSVSQSSAVDWAKSKVGSGLDYDGEPDYQPFQCVDLIYYYYSYLGVSPVGGNACDYSSNALPAGWTRISSNIIPQPGDIAVWKTYYNDGVYYTGWAGHVGIVVSGNSSTFSTIHQNFNGYTTCIQSNNIPTAILDCVIRPNFSSTSTEPTLSWSEYVDKHSIGTQNATLAIRCDLSGTSAAALSKAGIYLYDYSGKQLNSFNENVSFGNYSYFTLWYDVNGELGYTLAEGTTYKYKFMAVIDGQTYYSPIYTFQTGGTHSHVYNSGTVITEATCTATGVCKYVCEKCGASKTESIAALGHYYSATWIVDKEATCTEMGSKSYHCIRCSGKGNVVAIAALGHDYESVWTVDKAATCTEAGSKSHHCTRCASKGSVTTIAATGHSYGSWSTTTAATCTAAGTQKRTCSKCFAVDKAEIAALGHNYAAAWTVDKEPTCTAEGSKSHHCTRCSSKGSVTAIAALEHNYVTTIITNPSLIVTGLQQKVCSVCEDTVTETLDMLVGRVHQWNIALQDDYAVNFNLQISESIESTAKVRLTVGDETATYSVSELKKTADGYFRLTANISAAQMNDFITVMVMNGREIGCNNTYTAREYCDTILADSTYSRYHPVVKEMLNYGAMAQIYFDYDTEYLANDGITGGAAKDVPGATEDLTVSDQISNLNFYGASLVYRDRIAVRYYFAGDVSGCTFTANGNTYTPVAKDGMHYVEIADILPQNLDQQITLTVTDANGNTLTAAYSPMNYIVRMNEKGSDTLKALVKALYNYHLAAKALST